MPGQVTDFYHDESADYADFRRLNHEGHEFLATEFTENSEIL